MLIFFFSIMVFHRNDFLIVSIVLLVKNFQTEATHSLFWLFWRGKRLKWESDVNVTVLSSAMAFCACRRVMKNEHRFFECWAVWCLTDWGRFERRVVVRTHAGSWWRGLLDLSCVVLDFVTDDTEWHLCNECWLLFKLKQWSALITFYSFPCIIIFSIFVNMKCIFKWMLTFKG